MDAAEAIRWARTYSGTDPHAAKVMTTLADRLETINQRGAQVRGGLKPHARPAEIVDYLLAEPGHTAR